jgi:predicted O-methyltransferase YrrM
MLTTKQYDAIFEEERRHSYPVVDSYVRQFGVDIDKQKLESMARTLACPLKVNPPNWQHGRVIYTTLRAFLERAGFDVVYPILDIGTAKGFSACVMTHAIADARSPCTVVSVDMVDPRSRVSRNSVAEIDGLKTVEEFTRDHAARGVPLAFYGRGSVEWLNFALSGNLRVPFAFVDGKHTYEAVCFESAALMQLQRPGDVVIYDDCQIEPVGRAVKAIKGYSVMHLDIGPRTYAIAVRQ